MLNTYKLPVDVVCPLDGQKVTLEVVVSIAAENPVILVEDLLRICASLVSAQPMLQEGFTQALKRELDERYSGNIGVDTQGIHSGVEVTCRV